MDKDVGSPLVLRKTNKPLEPPFPHLGCDTRMKRQPPSPERGTCTTSLQHRTKLGTALPSNGRAQLGFLETMILSFRLKLTPSLGVC